MTERSRLNEKELLQLEAEYCSYGDTVHYIEPPKIFEQCEGAWLYDAADRPYLDMQMWYSAVNFGYRNREIEALHNEQLSRLPQLASQYLHKEKILLAVELARETEKRFGLKGRVHFNVGGAQAIEDSMKLVRNYRGGKSLMFAFMGGYHGRTLGCSEITSSYRYRRRYGHFGNRAAFIPFPYCYRCFYGLKRESCGYECVNQFEKLFETEYYGVLDPKADEAEFAAFYVEPLQATGGYIAPPPEYFPRLDKILKRYNILLVDDEIQMGFYRTGKLWSLEHFGVKPDVVAFAKSLTNGLNPLSGIWAKEEMISPQIFPPGSTHSTFSSNPLGTAAGLATMRYINSHDFETGVKEKGGYLLGRLRNLQSRHAVIGDVDGLGLALRIEMTTADGFTPDKALTDKIVDEGMKGDVEVNGKRYGLVLDVGGHYKNTFTLAPGPDDKLRGNGSVRRTVRSYTQKVWCLMAKEPIRLAGGPAGAVLIHGLTGSPFELKYLAGQLNRAGYAVTVPCLAGHSGTIRDLKKTVWQDWYASVTQAIDELEQTCSEVVVAGLCMGAVLALHAAYEYGSRIRAVGAMSTTLRFDGWSVPWYGFLIPLNHYTPIRYLYSYPEREPYGIKNERLRRSVAKGLKENTVAYDCVPGVSMYQLNKLAKTVIPELPAITAPTLIIHSREDDTAAVANADLVEKRIGARDVRKVILDDCYHMITIDNQRETVAKELAAFFTARSAGGHNFCAG